MQTVRNGVYEKLQEFTPERLEAELKTKDVDHVEVFPATKENIETRTARVGKKYKPKKGFKKVPKIKSKNQ